MKGMLLDFIVLKLELLNSTSIYGRRETTVISHIALFTNIYQFQEAFYMKRACILYCIYLS